MAVVNLKADVFTGEQDPAKLRGETVTTTFTVANGGTDSSLSTYRVGSIPAEALFDEATMLKVDGWGFANVYLGTKTDNDAVGTVAKATGTYWSPIVLGDGKHGLPAWQALGLAANPGGNIDLYLHAAAGATGAGTCKGKIVYRYR